MAEGLVIATLFVVAVLFYATARLVWQVGEVVLDALDKRR